MDITTDSDIVLSSISVPDTTVALVVAQALQFSMVPIVSWSLDINMV